MGLFNTYGNNLNKVENSLLSTVYTFVSREVVDPFSHKEYVRYTRLRTKTYKYIGMTKDAARQCMVDKRAKYVRRAWQWVYNADTGLWEYPRYTSNSILINAASVSASPVGGGMWDTTIQVNESVSAYSNHGEVEDLGKWFDSFYGVARDDAWIPWDYDDGEF